MVDGILDAPERHIVYDVPCKPDDEEVAYPLIEKDLRRDAGIGASDDDGKGFLPFRDLVTAFFVLIRVIGRFIAANLLFPSSNACNA